MRFLMAIVVDLFLLLASSVVASCGDTEGTKTFTTPLGVKVVTREEYRQYTADDIDSVLVSATVEPLEIRDDDTWHTIISTVVFTLGEMQSSGLPSIEFFDGPVAECPLDEDDYAGCYHEADNRIVIRILDSTESCIAVETRLSHFTAHYLQRVKGLDVDHDPPMWPSYGESLELQTQRWFYRATCR